MAASPDGGRTFAVAAFLSVVWTVVLKSLLFRTNLRYERLGVRWRYGVTMKENKIVGINTDHPRYNWRVNSAP